MKNQSLILQSCFLKTVNSWAKIDELYLDSSKLVGQGVFETFKAKYIRVDGGFTDQTAKLPKVSTSSKEVTVKILAL